MTKIYTDHKTLEQDIVKDQVNELQKKGLNEALLGGACLIASGIPDSINVNRMLQGEKISQGWRWAGGFLTVVGLFELVKSFFTANKAHDRKHELERLGSQEVVVFPENYSHTAIPNFEIPHKSFTQIIPQTTLLEQTEKKATFSKDF
jgi:hypothetical protein